MRLTIAVITAALALVGCEYVAGEGYMSASDAQSYRNQKLLAYKKDIRRSLDSASSLEDFDAVYDRIGSFEGMIAGASPSDCQQLIFTHTMPSESL